MQAHEESHPVAHADVTRNKRPQFATPPSSTPPNCSSQPLTLSTLTLTLTLTLTPLPLRPRLSTKDRASGPLEATLPNDCARLPVEWNGRPDGLYITQHPSIRAFAVIPLRVRHAMPFAHLFPLCLSQRPDTICHRGSRIYRRRTRRSDVDALASFRCGLTPDRIPLFARDKHLDPNELNNEDRGLLRVCACASARLPAMEVV